MTVWITGANGFIGRHLARAMADGGEPAHGIGHGAIDEAERRRLGLQSWVSGDIDTVNLNALAGTQGVPSTVFHLAGGSSVGLSIAQPSEDFSRTVDSTSRLLEWLRATAPRCRVIMASSAAVYGSGHGAQISEDAALAPVSPYGEHKRTAEQLCESYAADFGVQSTIVRFFSVYGANLRKQLLWDICSRLEQGEDPLMLGGTGAEMRDWTDIRDVVRLLLKLAALPPADAPSIINGGSGRGASVAEVASLVVKNWGKPVRLRFSGASRVGDPFSLLSDPTRLAGLPFEWQIPIDDGIADYVGWFKARAR
jgi:UDP-glucose 4-epimerase